MTEILSPIPGVIKKVCVTDGDTIMAGEDVIILEAMNLEMPVLSSATGVVSIHVSDGDTVDANQLLIKVEEN